MVAGVVCGMYIGADCTGGGGSVGGGGGAIGAGACGCAVAEYVASPLPELPSAVTSGTTGRARSTGRVGGPGSYVFSVLF